MQFSVSDRHDMVVEQIQDTISEHELIPKGAHVVLGLSGGPDSVCMFHVLAMLAEQMDIKLHAVHVNHQLRGEAADQDQEFVEQLCLKADVPLDVIVFDCKKYADELRITTEEAGRIRRYQAFDDAADRIMRDDPDAEVRIAVAHNYDDQAETIMFRLMRGTGPDGLAGMEYIREDERGHMLIRPLLDCKKKDIVRFLMKEKIDARLDKTNEEAVYSRNAIRLDIFPFLEKYSPNFRDALVRLGNVAREDKALMKSLAEQVMEYAITEIGDGYVQFSRKKLSKISIPVRRRVLSLAASQIGLNEDLTQAHFKAADEILMSGGPSAGVDLPHKYRVYNVYDDIRIAAPDESGQAVPPGKAMVVTPDELEKMELQKGRFAAFDAGALELKFGRGACENAMWRRRESGDYMEISASRRDAANKPEEKKITFKLGLTTSEQDKPLTKKLQDIFVDGKIPKENRDSIYFGAVGSEVLFIPEQDGFPRARWSTGYKVTGATKRVLLFTI